MLICLYYSNLDTLKHHGENLPKNKKEKTRGQNILLHYLFFNKCLKIIVKIIKKLVKYSKLYFALKPINLSVF